MVFNILAFDGMKGLLIVLDNGILYVQVGNRNMYTIERI